MKITGAVLIILALVIGIVPQFTDCASHGRAIELANGRTIPMKCHWTAKAELAVAGPMLALGVLTIVNKRKDVLASLAVLGVILGAFAFLLPTNLIGVCASDEMLCNVAMKPTLMLTGILSAVDSLAIFVMSRNRPLEIPVAKAEEIL
jgi:hypothetical protein